MLSILLRFVPLTLASTLGWLIAFGIRAWYRDWVTRKCHGGHKKKFLRLDHKSNLDCGNNGHSFHDTSEWWATIGTWACEEPGCNAHGTECFGTQGWWMIEHGQVILDQKKLTDPPPIQSPKQRMEEVKKTTAAAVATSDIAAAELKHMLKDIKDTVKDTAERVSEKIDQLPKGKPAPQAGSPVQVYDYGKHQTASEKLLSANIEEKVIEAILEIGARIPKDGITRESHFLHDLGFDSLDAVELTMAIEDKFDIAIPDGEAEKIRTVNDAIVYLERLRKGGTRGQA
jgi:acyl carrier protein